MGLTFELVFVVVVWLVIVELVMLVEFWTSRSPFVVVAWEGVVALLGGCFWYGNLVGV